MARKVKETDDLPKAKVNKTSLKKALRIFYYTGKHKWKLYLGMFFLLLTGGTALVFPMMLGDLISTIELKNYDRINTIGLYLVVVLSLQSVFSYFRIYLFVNYTENTLAGLRQAVYAHLI